MIVNLIDAVRELLLAAAITQFKDVQTVLLFVTVCTVCVIAIRSTRGGD